MKKFILGVAALFLMAFPISANAEDFYAGKVVKIIVGSGSGGGMALNAQLLSKFISAHIPGNPTVIVTYKKGSGGAVLANYLANSTKTDGTEIGMLTSTTLMSGVLKKKKIHFDLDSFTFVGGLDNARSAVVVRASTGVNNLADARDIQVIMGATSPRSQTSVIPYMMNKALGTKFKVVTGFKGTGSIFKAITGDEVKGVAMTYSSIVISRPQWLDDGYVNVLAISALTREPTMPDVPLLIELATDPVDKKVFEFMSTTGAFGRAFLTSSKVPQERLDILRKAFNDTMTDPAFREFAASRKFSIHPVSWQTLHSEVDRMKAILVSNPEVADMLRKAMGIKVKE